MVFLETPFIIKNMSTACQSYISLFSLMTAICACIFNMPLGFRSKEIYVWKLEVKEN